MTMLDDYEPKYKLSGVMIVQEMMNTVPGSLLRRTGVEGLIRSVSCSRPTLLIGVLTLFQITVVVIQLSSTPSG